MTSSHGISPWCEASWPHWFIRMLCWWFCFRDMSSSLTLASALALRKPTALNSIETSRTTPPATSVSHFEFDLRFLLPLSFSHTLAIRFSPSFSLSLSLLYPFKCQTSAHYGLVFFAVWFSLSLSLLHPQTHAHTSEDTYAHMHTIPSTHCTFLSATIVPRFVCLTTHWWSALSLSFFLSISISISPARSLSLSLHPPPQPFRTWTRRGKQRHGKRTEGSW